MTIQQAFDRAVQQHQAGQLTEAESLYRQILAQQPDHANSLHLLGVLAGQVNHLAAGNELLSRALAVRPEFPEAWFDLGNNLQSQGRLADAVTAFRHAIDQRPNYAIAYNNMANALQTDGRSEEAIAACRQALALQPNLAAAYNNLGNALQGTKRADEAIVSYQHAITLKADFAAAHFNLGNACQSLDRLEEAIACYRRALVLQPGFIPAHVALGGILVARGRSNEAISAYQNAVQLSPEDADAWYCLGNAQRACGQLDESIESYRQAVRLRPDHAATQANLANALKDAGLIDEAIDCYRRARALVPDNARFHSNLLLIMNFHPDANRPDWLFEEARRWSMQHEASLAPHIQPHPNDRDPDRRLRIGYVSRDFREHPVARNILPLFREHEHEQFEIICYAEIPGGGDEMTDKFRRCADQWRDTTGLSDAAMGEIIRDDRIDILVDLALHTDQNRLLVFARRPAPVQVTFAGYPGTTGMQSIDYRLTDPWLDPPSEVQLRDQFYSEEPLRLADTFWCYDPQSLEPAVNALPARTNGFITFGCLNNFCKVNESSLQLWARVLNAVNNSRLMLLTIEGRHRQRALDVLKRSGVGRERIEYVAPRSRPLYLQLYSRIDLGLDTFPYNGHTTSLDSFWMGVPVVSLRGTTPLARAGYCQLMNLSLPELVARDPDEFVRIAVELAGSQPRLSALRSELRERMQASPLMNATKYARSIESAYRQMWRGAAAPRPGEK